MTPGPSIAPCASGARAPISMLVVGDAAGDAASSTDHLIGDRVAVRRAGTVAAALAALRHEVPDCIVLHLAVPGAAGLPALEDLRRSAPGVPVVVLGGVHGCEAPSPASGVHDRGGTAAPVPGGARYAAGRARAGREHEALPLTDALTGLPNRARLMDRVLHALQRMPRARSSVALLFLDVDRFKLVNDSLGHSAGDDLLRAVGERLRRAVRPADTVARFAGDEFAVLCEDLHEPAEAEIVVDRIHRALGAPVTVEGHDVVPSASIGVAFADSAADSPERLVQDAAAAMHGAKARGTGHARFAEEMRTRARQRLELEAELHHAVRAEQFEVHYQPVVVLARPPQVAGVEALVRWRHPRRGLLMPDSFIRAAEETGLIRRLGAWVLREACAQLAAWDAAGVGGGALTMSVNLSPQQLAGDAVVRAVEQVLARHAFAPHRLCLEITETVLLDPAAGGPDRLRRLKALGVQIAMDDFGTGYASLASLTAFPVDVLKIDRGFVGRMRADDASRRIVAAVAGLARGLGLETVAEGVEQPGLEADLRRLGCRRAQGFAFARPLPAAELTPLLADRAPEPLAAV